MTAITIPPSHLKPRPGLAAELHAVDLDYPGWHAWPSSSGRIIAVHSMSAGEMAAVFAGCGVTLDAPTPELIRHEIAKYLQHAAVAA